MCCFFAAIFTSNIISSSYVNLLGGRDPYADVPSFRGNFAGPILKDKAPQGVNPYDRYKWSYGAPTNGPK